MYIIYSTKLKIVQQSWYLRSHIPCLVLILHIVYSLMATRSFQCIVGRFLNCRPTSYSSWVRRLNTYGRKAFASSLLPHYLPRLLGFGLYGVFLVWTWFLDRSIRTPLACGSYLYTNFYHRHILPSFQCKVAFSELLQALFLRRKPSHHALPKVHIARRTPRVRNRRCLADMRGKHGLNLIHPQPLARETTPTPRHDIPQGPIPILGKLGTRSLLEDGLGEFLGGFDVVERFLEGAYFP